VERPEVPPIRPGAAGLARIRELRLRSARERTGLHYVEGLRAVLQALAARVPVELLVTSEVLCRNALAQKTVRLRKRDGVPVLRVTPEEFRSVSTAARASGLGAILRQRWTPLERLDPRRGLAWIAVRRLRSPGNLGTILRTAEAAGAGGLLLLGGESDPFDPDVVRASMGAVFHLEMVRTTLATVAAWARSHRSTVLGLSPAARLAYTEAPVNPPLIILLGEERAGLTREEQAACTHLASIPIVGRANSLNVGVAAGVMLYEVLRRRYRPGSLRAPT
jgi:TrmH family RNA methyltransferase